MKESHIRLKTITQERERIWKKVVQEYEDYKGHPPATPDAEATVLKKSVASLFSATSELVEGYQDYIRALEEELGVGK